VHADPAPVLQRLLERLADGQAPCVNTAPSAAVVVRSPATAAVETVMARTTIAACFFM
jgi:hypothetical protein